MQPHRASNLKFSLWFVRLCYISASVAVLYKGDCIRVKYVLPLNHPEKSKQMRRILRRDRLWKNTAGRQVIQKTAQIFRTMRILSENVKNTCFFSGFAVKYIVHHSVPQRKESNLFVCAAWDNNKKRKGRYIMARANNRLTAGKIVCRVLIVILTTLILTVIALYLLMLVIAKGPSPSAKKLFVCTVKETSAIGFLANWYYSDEEIAEYLGSFRDNTTEEVTNPELVKIAPKTEGQPATDSSGKVQPETELVDVSGKTFRGKLLKIKDPSRVYVGISGQYGAEYEGKRVLDMVAEYGALAAINAGGFEDLNGVGNGGTPLGMVVSQGEVRWGMMDTSYDIIGFDNDNILHVGTMTGQQAKDIGIRDAVCFGPVLIVNGKPVNEEKALGGGFNPRSAIGQAADGTVLLLVIDGRQANSLGATYDDIIDIMLKNGAVNAANLDGGSSSHMIYQNEIITVCSSLYGPRRMPTCWLVAPEN